MTEDDKRGGRKGIVILIAAVVFCSGCPIPPPLYRGDIAGTWFGIDNYSAEYLIEISLDGTGLAASTRDVVGIPHRYRIPKWEVGPRSKRGQQISIKLEPLNALSDQWLQMKGQARPDRMLLHITGEYWKKNPGTVVLLRERKLLESTALLRDEMQEEDQLVHRNNFDISQERLEEPLGLSPEEHSIRRVTEQVERDRKKERQLRWKVENHFKIRKAFISAMITLVEDEERPKLVRALAMRTLGDLRSTEAVMPLLWNILLRQRQYSRPSVPSRPITPKSSKVHMYYPAVTALINIGIPARQGILAVMTYPDQTEDMHLVVAKAQLMAEVLIGIEGLERAVEFVREELEKMKDEQIDIRSFEEVIKYLLKAQTNSPDEKPGREGQLP